MAFHYETQSHQELPHWSASRSGRERFRACATPLVRFFYHALPFPATKGTFPARISSSEMCHEATWRNRLFDHLGGFTGNQQNASLRTVPRVHSGMSD
jgi:hypothetical protein